MFFIVVTLLLFDFKNNLTTAVVIFLKANALLVFTFALVLPLGVVKLARTLEELKVPKNFTLMMLLSYRYIYSIREEYEKISKAAKLRGFEPGFNIRTYRTYGYMLGMLTLKTYFKARQVYKAMVCRGFGG
jgi:cobalt/nickel transport system permease protein